ncbi:MAG: hypothetical protein ACKO3R_03250 [bacterium]
MAENRTQKLHVVSQCPIETATQRAVSRLRRTNDRSVLEVISSDAKHTTLMSYASKQKYKLDLSSLHEDHEAGENAGNGVVSRSLLEEPDGV